MNDTDIIATGDTFTVWQFLVDNISEKVRDHVPAKDAVQAAYHYTHNVAAMCGITRRVIIVDNTDSVVFEWRQGEGVVFPEPEAPRREYSK